MSTTMVPEIITATVAEATAEADMVPEITMAIMAAMEAEITEVTIGITATVRC